MSLIHQNQAKQSLDNPSERPPMSYDEMVTLSETLDPHERLFIEAYMDRNLSIEAAFRYLLREGGAAEHLLGASDFKPIRYYQHLIAKNETARTLISWHLDNVAMNADETLYRIAEIARGDIGDFLKMKVDQETGEIDVEFDLLQAIKRGKTHLIKEIKKDKHGNLTLKLHDALAAQQSLAKYHQLFSGDSDSSNNNQLNLNLNMSDLSAKQLREIFNGQKETAVLKPLRALGAI